MMPINDIAKRGPIMIDNAATASQCRALVDDAVVREAITLNIIAPLLIEISERDARKAEASEGERRGLERTKAGWNACRKSIYAVCEDVEREAEEAGKHEGEYAKGYAAGMARAAKSIARGFNAMEAEDDDHFRALIPAPAREGE